MGLGHLVPGNADLAALVRLIGIFVVEVSAFNEDETLNTG